MTSVEEVEAAPADEVPAGNPEEISKNPTALKDAYEKMATLDVLVCGQCHSAFHFVEEFKEHKDSDTCSSKSPVRDSNESKAQVWAFLLWKCSSTREGSLSVQDHSWRLYQQWCRMAEPQRTAWITAGAEVQNLAKFSHAKLIEKEVPEIPTPATEPKKRGRKKMKADDSETQPSGDESDSHAKAPKKVIINKPPPSPSKTKVQQEIDSLRSAQERVPAEQRIARRTEREGVGEGDKEIGDGGEYVVEKILAKRFNPRRKQYEYLLKWEGYTHEQNTWEPMDNMNTCMALLDAFEKQLARQKELKALRAQQQQGTAHQVAQPAIKQEVKSPSLTPSGRLQRTSKARALDQVKAWCGGAEDGEPAKKRLKKDMSTDDDDSYSDPDFNKGKKLVNGTPSKSTLDQELVKSLGLGGNIKGVIKVDPKHMPSLSSGVYIMSKSSGIMKIDAPGKLGPGLNIDQDVIRKQIMAAKQKKEETTPKKTPARTPVPQKKEETTLKKTPIRTPVPQVKKSVGPSGQEVVEKTIITPSGQKIIQRTIHRPSMGDHKSPINILNKKLQSQDNSLLRRGGAAGRGRGRGGGYISTAAGNLIRVRDKTEPEFAFSDASSDTSDGIEDPFPKDPGPLPPPSPERPITICPLTGKRLARAEGEPTPPPTPSPPPTPPPQPQMLMKVEMSPGGTTGRLVQGDATQQSLPMLTDDDGTEVKHILGEESIGVDEGDEVNLLQSGHPPIMIRGEDGVLYQVAGENEAGQTLLVAAEGMEEGAVEAADDNVMYVTREEDQQETLTIDPSQLAHLLPGADGPALQQVAVQVEGEPGEDATQVIAQLVQADLPSPGGTRRVVLLLPDGSFTMTELDKEQYESITEGGRQE